jgi:hypothetical protein
LPKRKLIFSDFSWKNWGSPCIRSYAVYIGPCVTQVLEELKRAKFCCSINNIIGMVSYNLLTQRTQDLKWGLKSN